MKVEMLMPQMGESITEATVSKWLKNVGDSVEKDEIILEISTDKVDSEIPSPAAGVIVEIIFQENDVVPVKTKIAVIDTEASAGATPSQPESQPAAPEPEPTPTPQAAPVEPSPSVVVESDHTESSDRFYSPLVKSLAAKHGIPLRELDALPGSGKGNRFTKQDFLAYLEDRDDAPQAAPSQPKAAPQAPPAPPKSAPAAPTPPPAEKSDPVPALGEWQADGTKIVPMDNMRKAIAEHMVRSKQTSPHVYSVQEVDVSKIATWRAKYKSEFKAKEGFNLSFTPFFLEAAIKGLQQFPIINSSVEGNTVVYRKNINLGCAVALGNTGLIVPVIKNADERNLVGVARSLNDLATRARNKKLLPDDVMGGSFTVTNPGVFGTVIGTPIINQPQVAILCLGKIEKRPVVIDDMIAIRQMCYLTLSYDHRVIDGAIGGQYLQFIGDYLSNWDLDRSLY